MVHRDAFLALAPPHPMPTAHIAVQVHTRCDTRITRVYKSTSTLEHRRAMCTMCSRARARLMQLLHTVVVRTSTSMSSSKCNRSCLGSAAIWLRGLGDIATPKPVASQMVLLRAHVFVASRDECNSYCWRRRRRWLACGISCRVWP